MPDWKTVLVLVALTGGTNVLQYFGITLPTEKNKVQVTANQDFLRDELNACLAELKACYRECADVAHSGEEEESAPGDWSAEIPYPAQLAN